MNLVKSLAMTIPGVLLSTLCLAQLQTDEGEATQDGASSAYEAPAVPQSFAAPFEVETQLNEFDGYRADGGPTYEEISGILASNCLSCHGANRPRKGVRLDTEQFARQFAERASQEILAGSMPPRKRGFSESPEGMRLLEWFSQKP